MLMMPQSTSQPNFGEKIWTNLGSVINYFQSGLDIPDITVFKHVESHQRIAFSAQREDE